MVRSTRAELWNGTSFARVKGRVLAPRGWGGAVARSLFCSGAWLRLLVLTIFCGGGGVCGFVVFYFNCNFVFV